MMRGAVPIGVLGLAAALAGCNPAAYPACSTVCGAPYPPPYSASYAPLPAYPTPWDDPFADYTQRILTVSPSAGNAQAANTVLQTATPWPRYSSNTSIPANGARMVKAVQNYENGIVSPPAPLTGSGGATGGGGGASGGSGGTGGGATGGAVSGGPGG